MSFMQGLFGSKPKAAPTAASGVQLQSSSQGLPIPLVFGTTAVAPNLIWYGDFLATQQSSSAGSGGKGGGSGGKGGGGTSYTYQAAFAFGMCAGPIQGVGNVYVNKTITTLAALGYSLFTGSSLQSPWGYLSTNHPGEDLGYNYLSYIAAPTYQMGQSPQIPNTNIEVQGIYSNSLAQENYGEGWLIPATAAQGIVNSIGGSSTVSGGYAIITVNYASSFTSDGGVTDVAGNVYTAVGGSPGNLQYSVSAGVYTFNLAQANQQVFITYNASVGADADPSLIFNYLMTDPRQGALFPSGNLGSLSVWQAYCIANGLLLSPGYTQQNSASQMITDIMTCTNSNIVSSGGIVTVVPYGDESITANGYTYTAPSSPEYSLGDNDYVRVKNQDPVVVTQPNQLDVYNSINMTCLDRANQYNTTILNAKSQADIDTYGLRENTVDYRIFANLASAKLSLQLQLHRQQVRNQYDFTVDHRYLFLDPMDIISITDTAAGINNQWVRIISITEDDNSNFAITAEEYLTGNASAPTYTLQKGVGFSALYNSYPGDANTPAIFEPPVQISQTNGLEVDIAISGGTNFGGAQIWISADGDTYKQVGQVTGNCRQGTLYATLPNTPDPDLVDTLYVDLTEARGTLNSGTQADADNNHTICYVDGEYISYETATLETGYQYGLTYLRRGQFGSQITVHNSGGLFARMDAGIFAYPYDKSKIGTTLYVKLLAFNVYGGGLQSLNNVEPYVHVITGPYMLGQVQDFQAQQQGNVVAMSWQDLAYEGGLKGYDIAYGPVGSTWEQKTYLTEALRGTEMTNASVPPGTWDISIRAHDIADNLGPVATVSALIVTNTNSIISSATQEPAWLGNIGGSMFGGTLMLLLNSQPTFVRHYTGTLIPANQFPASYYGVISPPSAPSTGTVVGGALGLTTYYVKTTYVDATGETTASAESTQIVAALSLLVVNSPAASGLASGYNVYVSTTTGTETLQNATPVAIAANWTEPASGLVAGVSPPTYNMTGYQCFDEFVPDPVPVATYTAPTVDTGYNDNLRVYASINYGFGPENSGTPNLKFEIDTWLNGNSDPIAFEPWVIGFIYMEYMRGQLVYNNITQDEVAYITDFTPIIDNPDNVENQVATIAPGGTTVTFPVQFHAAPFVSGTVISGAGLFMEATSITATNCVINVYNTSDVSVGGVVNYSATGQ